ncbi:HAD hydrolase-like protein [Shewanella sp. 202IG2-18]|uniref:HAD hydrolase-like protein n=1 Tax=Parashewanella hymeniacidonis TaxID=2807618 RepID=UPI00196066F8|nr:HAD hydrolase-like protein [Parashewanella hymeniacidonis]MBM7070637.1 HAD hydrolase-like protein [Parashewanella hymeniacidonis]
MAIKLLFDLDGTISDPLEGIANSINYALEAFGYSQSSQIELANYIGPPLDKTFSDITQTDDKAHILALVTKYRERFAVLGYKENQLYDGVKSILLELKKRNISVAVCTSKPERFAVKILEHFDLLDCFEFVSGGEVGVEKWQQIVDLKHQGLVDEDTIMIGDRAVDITAAKHSGLKTSGVLWGYGSIQEIESEQPDYIFEYAGELMSLIQPA